MTTKLIGNRVVTIGLVTMLAPLGSVLAGAAPAAGPPTPLPVRYVELSAPAPRPLAGSNADAPWLYENLISYPQAQPCPLKRLDAPLPAEPMATKQPALAELQPPGIVQNLRRTDRP